MTRPPGSDEPRKTPTAVGFQLVEIIAALQRSREAVRDPELRGCFTPVLGRCRKLLDNLVRDHAELLHAGFDRYRRLFVEDAA